MGISIISSDISNNKNEGFPNKVAIIYSDVKREYFPTEEQYITEKGSENDANVISHYLNNLGIDTMNIPANDNLTNKLISYKPDMAFQLVDSVKGFEYLSATIPGILEMLEIPYTGADILGLSLCYNKFLIKSLLQQAGIPTPNCQLFLTPTDPINLTLRFPLISKLNEIHGAVEITKNSISSNEKELRERIKFLINTYKQPILVEEFIVGREVVALVLEGANKKVYMAERVFEEQNANDNYRFASFEYQWLDTDQDNRFHYEKYNDQNLKELVKKAFDITKMADYGKFDIRIDASDRYYFIDSNPNTFFGPKEIDSPMGNILETIYGVDFNEVLKRLILNTIREKEKKEKIDFNGEFPY